MSDSRSSGVDMYRDTPSPTPITRAPPEILCYIFAFTLPSPSRTATVHDGFRWMEPAGGEPGIIASPWILGQVCSRWRALSVAFPALWTSISVSSNLMARHLTMLECQLKRTGVAPLDIHIRLGWTGCPSPEFDFFLPLLVSQSTRWRKLHLELHTPWHPHKAFEPLTSGSLPLLESVAFSGEQPEYLENYTFFQHAPALRSIALRSCGMHFIRKIPLPWAQLTCLNLYPISRNGFHAIPQDPPPDLCNLPCLRRLAVSQSWLLGPVVAPALRSLHTVGPVEPVLRFLDRSRCTHSLSDLTLADCSSSAQTVITLLQQTVNLGSLRIQPTDAPAELVASLKHLCPRLISLSWADLDDMLGDGAFADLVVARCGNSSGGQCLTFAALYAGQRRRMQDQKRLRALTTIEVVILSGTKGHPPVAQWRDFSL